MTAARHTFHPRVPGALKALGEPPLQLTSDVVAADVDHGRPDSWESKLVQAHFAQVMHVLSKPASWSRRHQTLMRETCYWAFDEPLSDRPNSLAWCCSVLSHQLRQRVDAVAVRAALKRLWR